VDGYFLYISLV